MRRSQDLMPAASSVLSHAGIELVLALLKAGRIPYPDASRWVGGPVRAGAARAALCGACATPHPGGSSLAQQPVSLTDEFWKMRST
jgi:hypothetical protein